jgi:tetratricopeptide (TPR) repeat protein
VADVATLFKQAEAAWRAGNGAEAKAAAEHVLADDPAHAGALMILTNLCFAAGDVAGARPHLARLAILMPDDPMILGNLGRACLAAEDLGAAAEAFATVLQIEPANARALDGLGIVRHRQGDYAAAADLHGRAVAADPAFAAGWCNLGIACTDLGRYADGAAALDRALALDPDDARTRFNRAILYLMAGEFTTGWPMYEARLAFQNIAKPPGARWGGDSLTGERVLLIPEQGFGDVIQFARFASRVRDRGGVPVLAVPGPLTALMAAQGWDVDIADAAAPPEAPLWCPLMSLGAVFDLTAGDISGAAYLRAPSIDNAKNAGPRVGLAWAGNPAHRRDGARSLRLADLAPVFDIPGIRFVNLQVGLRPDDAAEMARRPDLFAEAPVLNDFADTAVVVAGLDLVISADTAVLHLAGAMGRPAWGLLPFVPDWRWGPSGETTPWYDSLRLYRQPALGDWPSVARQVAADLGRLGKG